MTLFSLDARMKKANDNQHPLRQNFVANHKFDAPFVINILIVRCQVFKMFTEKRVGSIQAVKTILVYANLLFIVIALCDLVIIGFFLFKSPHILHSQLLAPSSHYATFIKHGLILIIGIIGFFGARREAHFALYLYSLATILGFWTSMYLWAYCWSHQLLLDNLSLIRGAISLAAQLLLASTSGGLGLALHYESLRYARIRKGYQGIDKWRGRIPDHEILKQ